MNRPGHARYSSVGRGGILHVGEPRYLPFWTKAVASDEEDLREALASGDERVIRLARKWLKQSREKVAQATEGVTA